MHEHEFDPPIDPKTQWLTNALLEREDCAVLRELNRLRKIGWSSAVVHDHFKSQRFQADYAKEKETDQKWLAVMFDSLRAMDYANNGFVRTAQFLDIGCCPGGYATYILRTCPSAVGMGISLPIENGGHASAIPRDLLPRIDLRMIDVSLLDLAPGSFKLTPSPLAPIPFSHNSFDFIVADGHHLRLNPDKILRPWNWTRLLISQILLALRAVSPGGTIFLKLSHVERSLTARILVAFYRISGYTHTIKSKVIHQTRGSFYLLAKGIRVHSYEYHKLVFGLTRLWCMMNFGGEKGYGRDIRWEEWDMITPWREVMSPHGVNQIARLGKHMWRIQAEALRRFLANKGVEISSN